MADPFLNPSVFVPAMLLALGLYLNLALPDGGRVRWAGRLMLATALGWLLSGLGPPWWPESKLQSLTASTLFMLPAVAGLAATVICVLAGRTSVTVLACVAMCLATIVLLLFLEAGVAGVVLAAVVAGLLLAGAAGVVPGGQNVPVGQDDENRDSTEPVEPALACLAVGLLVAGLVTSARVALEAEPSRAVVASRSTSVVPPAPRRDTRTGDVNRPPDYQLLSNVLTVSATVFALAAGGLMVRRHLAAVLPAIGFMFLSAILALAGFSNFYNSESGETFALAAIGVMAFHGVVGITLCRAIAAGGGTFDVSTLQRLVDREHGSPGEKQS